MFQVMIGVVFICCYIQHTHTHTHTHTALSLSPGKTTVMHMILRETLPDESNTCEIHNNREGAFWDSSLLDLSSNSILVLS